MDETRQSPLLKGPYVSLSRPFRQGAAVDELVREGVFHPHMRQRIPAEITHVYGHQENAIHAIRGGRTTLVSTGTGSGKTECFLYPIVSKCPDLKDAGASGREVSGVLSPSRPPDLFGLRRYRPRALPASPSPCRPINMQVARRDSLAAGPFAGAATEWPAQVTFAGTPAILLRGYVSRYRRGMRDFPSRKANPAPESSQSCSAGASPAIVYLASALRRART